ncbi:MAG: phospholipid/cholesterol/gamma-HCH transport system ATP-binding protein [Lysobacterales bacterium]|jgi:phospholipid/cholesterol/gamma-HCH transport system ATP-binding protein
MTKSSEIAISVKNIVKEFEGRRVLDDVSLNILKGEIFVIMGGSGSGKSTLLRIMTGGVKATSGQVLFNDKDLSLLSGEEEEKVKRRFGMSFQSAALLDFMNVEQNVSLPLKEHTNLDDKIISIITKMKLSLVGLQGYEHLMPSELSGGMKKRVGLARAIAMDPEAVFYDEPTAGLDPVVCSHVDKLILDLTQKLNLTSVVVTHNMRSAFGIADRIAMIYQGKILQVGTPDEIKNSNDPIVKQFISGDIEGPIQIN